METRPSPFDRFNALPLAAKGTIWAMVFAVAVGIPGLLGQDFMGDRPLVGNYGMLMLARIAVFAIAALGLNIQVGYTGLLNLGFAGFMAIGAYTSAILATQHDWIFWETIPAAMLHAAFWGIVLGYPTLRLTGDYFAIVTFAFSELVVMAARNWRSITNGTQGISGIHPPVLHLGFTDVHFDVLHRYDYYALNACFLALACWGMWRLTHSRLGRSWRAIREDEVAAQACGINCKWAKTLAFACSAALGGLAGALLANISGGCFPNDFVFMEGVTVLVYVVFGGMGSILGSVMGTVILMTLIEGLRQGLDAWNHDHPDLPLPSEIRWVAYGLILILIVRLRPEGLFPSRRVRQELHPETIRMAQAMDEGNYASTHPLEGRLR